MQTTIFGLCFIILVKYSDQKSSPTSKSYTAAVVEFSPNDPTSSGVAPNRINAARYVAFIENATKQIHTTSHDNVRIGLRKFLPRFRLSESLFGDVSIYSKKDVDIIVFPEAGLTSVNEPARQHLDSWSSLIPSPSENYNPCIHTTVDVSETVKVISCSARDNMIYVVINLAEKVFCTDRNCPSDQRLYYNTNVVFDREGKIIARYRKTNLYVEPGFNVPSIPELTTFQTDFGVTFGTFICFDILFKKPAMYLTRMLEVTDIVFPTAWFSEVPFLTALQIQAGWSYAEDVNLLASGYNRPEMGNAGSGIYLGRQGVAKAIIPNSTTNEMLIAEVPKKNFSEPHYRSRPRYEYTMEEIERPITPKYHVHDELRRKRRSSTTGSTIHQSEINELNGQQAQSSNGIKDGHHLSLFHENLSSYKFHPLNSSVSQSICDGNFCCHFDIQISGVDPESNYQIVVYNGTRTFGQPVTVGLQVCAVILCTNESSMSCGYLKKSAISFNVLSINVTFPNYEDVLIVPSSLGSDLLPLPNWHYEEQWEDKKVQISANLNVPSRNIVTCGVYARDFSKDSWNNEADSTISMQWATLTALGMVSLFLLFLYRKGWRKPWQRNNGLSSEYEPYQNS